MMTDKFPATVVVALQRRILNDMHKLVEFINQGSSSVAVNLDCSSET